MYKLIVNYKIKFIKSKSNILNGKETDPKVYWTILNYFVNNIKIPSIPPIFARVKTITSTVDKVNLFNNFLLQNAPPLGNSRTFPPFLMKTDKRIKTKNFNENDIVSLTNC